MLSTGQDQPGGLRERKKARTRASIREHALRLFREQTYQGTTVEQIAAAAEVSPSTFFRYFPSKEDVVLQDDMDTRMIEALERQPAGLAPVTAVRAASREVFTSYTQADLDRLDRLRGGVAPHVLRGELVSGLPGQPRHEEEDRERDRADQEQQEHGQDEAPDDEVDHRV